MSLLLLWIPNTHLNCWVSDFFTLWWWFLHCWLVCLYATRPNGEDILLSASLSANFDTACDFGSVEYSVHFHYVCLLGQALSVDIKTDHLDTLIFTWGIPETSCFGRKMCTGLWHEVAAIVITVCRNLLDIHSKQASIGTAVFSVRIQFCWWNAELRVLKHLQLYPWTTLYNGQWTGMCMCAHL